MKILAAIIAGCVLLNVAASAADSANRITPALQAALDAQKKIVSGWASSPVLVKAALAQNERGPLSGMTNRNWKRESPEGGLVQGFEKNAASVWLARKIAEGAGRYREAFVSAAKGELAAFADKPSAYLHAGAPKFDLPMSGRPWQGKPEFDRSSYSYVVQIAEPIRSGGKPVGVLVVGVSMKALKAMVSP